MLKQKMATPKASEAARQLKKRLMKLPAAYFDPLMFGELKIGQRFICLPLPGDNDGHGGLRGAHFIFIKTQNQVHGFGAPQGQAMGDGGAVREFPVSMYVILIY